MVFSSVSESACKNLYFHKEILFDCFCGSEWKQWLIETFSLNWKFLLARKGLLIPKKLSVFSKQAWLFLVSVRLRFTSRIWLFHRHMLLIGDLFVFVFYHLSNSEHFNCCWYWFCPVFLCIDFQSRIWL